MRVAALCDVHGNLPALEAVLAEVPADAAIVIGGDVAAGPFPAETLERLRGLGDRVHWLRGNADRELASGEEGIAPPHLIEWIKARLSDEQIAFLHGLPPTVTLDVDGIGSVLFCHATPHNDMDVFTAVTPEERVAPVFAGVEADLVVCGHTHHVFDRTIAGVRVVNPGSVGMSYEDEPGACWALLGPAVAFRRTPFEEAPSDWPDDTPQPSRAEVLEYLEAHAVGS
jgi:putative phosphoesterase